MRSAIFVLVVSLMIGLPVYADSHGAVADEVIALAKAQWAANMAKDTDKSVSQLADDYTEFNADYPTRIDSKQLNATLYKASDQGAGKLLAAEMANPKVQVYGDVAILTYNYIGSTLKADGEVEPSLAKSTRVYAKIDGAWKLVHANFAPVN
jgi:ketosteroid isomerase-like protein